MVKFRFHNFRGNPFARNKVRSPKFEIKLLFWNVRGNPFSHEMKFSRQKLKNCGKISISQLPRQPFRTKWGSIAKDWNKIALLKCPRQPFRTKWGSVVKNITTSQLPRQPFRAKWGSIARDCGKTAHLEPPHESQRFGQRWLRELHLFFYSASRENYNHYQD